MARDEHDTRTRDAFGAWPPEPRPYSSRDDDPAAALSMAGAAALSRCAAALTSAYQHLATAARAAVDRGAADQYASLDALASGVAAVAVALDGHRKRFANVGVTAAPQPAGAVRVQDAEQAAEVPSEGEGEVGERSP